MSRNRPRIIVLSADHEDFHWMSGEWNSRELGTAGTPEANRLMIRANEAITAAENAQDAMSRLRAAGFEVKYWWEVDE